MELTTKHFLFPPYSSPRRPTAVPLTTTACSSDWHSRRLPLAQTIQSETLKTLEWSSVCKQLSSFTSTSMGLGAARDADIPIGKTPTESQKLLDQTTAAVLTAESRPWDLSGIEDVSAVVELARKGELLTIGEICTVRRMLSAARKVGEELEAAAGGRDSFGRLGEGMLPFDESGLFKHNKQTYNGMAIVLEREDCIDRFLKLVDEMKVAGYEMEVETHVKVLGRFCKRKMISDAVYLYEFAMDGANRPSAQVSTFVLRKIAVSKDFDMGLFSRVVKVYTEKGNVLTDSMLYAVLKSLASVGRLGESDKVLKVMQERGFSPGRNLRSEIAFRLSRTVKKDEASKFMDTLESSGLNSAFRTITSLIEGHCVSGDLEKASAYFHEMVEKEVGSSASCALDSLVNAYCNKNREFDACRILKDCASNNELKPWHVTYKLLIKKLLAHGGFEDALRLLCLMKEHG